MATKRGCQRGLETKKARRNLIRGGLLAFSEDDGTRTRNHRIDSPNTLRRKLITITHLRLNRNCGCTLVARTLWNCLPTWLG
jgi:hypothetical protein